MFQKMPGMEKNLKKIQGGGGVTSFRREVFVSQCRKFS